MVSLKVGVIGTGHVGLPTAATIAALGHKVVATDADAQKLEQLRNGVMPFYEPGVGDLVTKQSSTGRLSFSTDPTEVVAGADVVFLCVGTPPRATGEANLLALEHAAETIARHATTDVVVVDKSTVPAGTAQRVGETLARYNRHLRFHVVSNPEFLREGSAVEDSLQPSRILIGSSSQEGVEVMRRLYAPLLEHGIPLFETDVATAELAKHASNAFLALKISFSNALARLCELAGADVVDIADAMGADPRIGRDFLDAGLGYGGYCFPKDLAAFEKLSERLGYEFPLLSEIRRINDEALDAAFQKIEAALWNVEGKRVAMLGLAFKPGTDDTRLSPALALVRRLMDHGAQVIGFDPQANRGAKAEIADLEVVDDPYTALAGAHCAVIATDWPEFKELDFTKAAEIMTFPILVDTRNLLDGRVAAAAGFTYHPTGRRPLQP